MTTLEMEEDWVLVREDLFSDFVFEHAQKELMTNEIFQKVPNTPQKDQEVWRRVMMGMAYSTKKEYKKLKSISRRYVPPGSRVKLWLNCSGGKECLDENPNLYAEHVTAVFGKGTRLFKRIGLLNSLTNLVVCASLTEH